MESGSCFEVYAEKKPSAKVTKVDKGKLDIPQLKNEKKVKVIDLGSALLIQRITA
ncbi:MAG: hypothetical protein ACE5DI_06190 [Candidatus Micrarchaeia archaeon]